MDDTHPNINTGNAKPAPDVVSNLTHKADDTGTAKLGPVPDVISKLTNTADLEDQNLASSMVDSPTPPDGGWGWVICFASFMCNLILGKLLFKHQYLSDYLQAFGLNLIIYLRRWYRQWLWSTFTPFG